MRAALQREDVLRRSPEAQRRFAEAESSGKTDWMEVAHDLQVEVLREFGVTDAQIGRALHELRTFANRHPELALYVRHNRARRGELREGDECPSVPLAELAGTGVGAPRPLLEFGGSAGGKPLVLIAGSYS